MTEQDMDKIKVRQAFKNLKGGALTAVLDAYFKKYNTYTPEEKALREKIKKYGEDPSKTFDGQVPLDFSGSDKD